MQLLLAAVVLAAANAEEPRVLRVGVAGSVPFIVDGSPPDGLAVDVFEAVAQSAGYTAELTPIASADDAIARVAKGEFDMVIGPLSVTADRLRSVSFTQPYFHAGLSALSRPEANGLLSRNSPLLSSAFFWGVAVLLLVLLGVGTMVWLMERRDNPAQFPADAPRGIGAGLWLALVTMTTVGYGDKAPVTTRGRLVTGVWMLISMMFASSLTAGIATALTLAQIDQAQFERPRELRGRRIATVVGSTSVEFARHYGAAVDLQPTLADAVKRLEAGEVDAVIFDRPMLQHFLSEHPGTHAVLSDAEWEPHGYAFAVPVGSPVLHPFNIALVEVMESGRLTPITDRWLGTQRQ